MSTFEYIIVGGGIYGCLTAYYLSKQLKNPKILLLESDNIASGASGGLGQRGIRANGRHKHELPFMSIAYDLWDQISKITNVKFNQIGSFSFYDSKTPKNTVLEQNQIHNKNNIPSEIIENKNELKNLEGLLNVNNVNGCIYCKNDGTMSHDRVTKSLAQLSVENGVMIKTGYNVVKLVKSTVDSKSYIVIAKCKELNDEIVKFECNKCVFLYCNYSVKNILKESFKLPVNLSIAPILPQILIHKKPLSNVKINHLIGHFSKRLAVKQLLLDDNDKFNDLLMISGGYLGKWNFKTNEKEVIIDNIKNNIIDFKYVFNVNEMNENNMNDFIAKVDRIESVCVDNIPIIDSINRIFKNENENNCNIVFGTGWSGHGFAIAPAVCKLVIEWVINNKHSNILKPFSIDRFLKKSKL